MKRPAKKLSELLEGIPCTLRSGAKETMVLSVVSDSRDIEEGALFVAIHGDLLDGHAFIPQAVKQGCSAVIVERGRFAEVGTISIPVIETDDSREALALVAAAFFDHPAQELVLIGITGTNGKTTISYLVEEIVKKAGGTPGVIGTVNYRYNGQEFPAPLTTPEPVILHRTFQKMLAAGVTHVIMEVSSHSLVQKRVFGVKFDVALFTNLSRDHLDFHGDMEEYFRAKKLLFTDNLGATGKAVVFCEQSSDLTSDQLWGKRLEEELHEDVGTWKQNGWCREIITCGFGDDLDLNGINAQYGLLGTKVEIVIYTEKIKINSPLVGRFNLKNILGAAGVGFALEFSLQQIVSALNSRSDVPGRLERIRAVSGPNVYVDYAHTPDALENVLTALRELNSRRIIVVFGCGGDRDNGKRSLMGRVAGRLADIVIITTDNPRSEAPEKIMSEIAEGVMWTEMVEKQRNISLIPSRREAIMMAIKAAREGDIVLIAGKGHETCQIVAGKRLHFDDREEASLCLSQWEKNDYDC